MDEIRKIQLKLPKGWNELKKGELETVAGYYLRYKSKAQLLTHCFLLFSGWKIIRWEKQPGFEKGSCYFRKKGEAVFRVEADVFSGLCKNLEWIIKGYTLPSHVPVIRGLESPNLILYRTTLEQYLMADNFYYRFISGGNFKDLNRMIAVLYCRNLADIDLERQARQIARRKKAQRYAVFIWLSGLKSWLREKYPYIFSGIENETGRSQDEAIMGLLTALNGGDITKNRVILSTGVHEALFELNQKMENYNSQKHVQAI